jgi:hypothetical protein
MNPNGNKKPGPKLDQEQRDQLLAWLAADYESNVIFVWFAEREWPELDRSTLTYYRKRYKDDIDQLRADRRSSAIHTGLALKEERVARLKAHADRLEEIKWIPGKTGKLYNEKAWRETLDDIAKELGQRRPQVINFDVDLSKCTDEQINRMAAGEDPLIVLGRIE